MSMKISLLFAFLASAFVGTAARAEPEVKDNGARMQQVADGRLRDTPRRRDRRVAARQHRRHRRRRRSPGRGFVLPAVAREGGHRAHPRGDGQAGGRPRDHPLALRPQQRHRSPTGRQYPEIEVRGASASTARLHRSSTRRWWSRMNARQATL